jgi:tRNA nucleotidyltransferase/poly(A) polymerase
VGLFSSLVLLPLAPVRGAAWVAQQVAEEADRQLYDESRIRRELLQLELDRDVGLISEEEKQARGDELLQRLAGRWGDSEGSQSNTEEEVTHG